MSAPHPYTLRQLQYAVAVADTLSFRQAAERCRVAQPSLSAQLAQLEDALGVRLFERDRRHVLITPAGAELLVRARRLLVEADDLVAAARQLGDPLTGSLRIGVIPTISPYLIPAIAPALRAAFPALELRWIEDKTEVLVRRLDDGTLDAALLALEAEIGDVEVEIVARDPFVLALPRDHPLARGKGALPAARVRAEPVLLLDEGHCFRSQALAYCGGREARELEFRATSLPTLVQMVAGGAGVTLLPALALATETPRGAVAIRPLAPVPHRTIALVWRRRSPLGAAFRPLAEVVRDAYPDPAHRIGEGHEVSRGATRRSPRRTR
jgi:LysR family hydrogen peroxide-inducible transcriptional activator